MPVSKDARLALFFILLTLLLHWIPTGYEKRHAGDAIRCQGEILEADDSRVRTYGIVSAGIQRLSIRIADGPFAGAVVEAHNEMLGKMDLDKRFVVGDRALVVLSLENGAISHAIAQDYYRLHVEGLLMGLFALLLLSFAGWTGLKALLSFVFSGYVIWKLLVPALLSGHDPILVGLLVVTLLTGAIIFLVGGLSRRAMAAFLGAQLGIITTCLLSLAFAGPFRLSGAVIPFSETLLYSGHAHLNLTRIFLAAIFIACSGAVMDLAMDVATCLEEVVKADPGIGFPQALASGLRVGRVVVGTMTTTLLLAYSGGYITLLMLFMAQNIPMISILNMNLVAAEVMTTLIGSIGLVLVAPFTALTGALLFVGRRKNNTAQ
ncbi:YibE/F family protein [Desulfovibrio psychrotolerans]|uniref:Membrane protein n=1 Tax=Desulfovibrio psychrotolerans TaxID=415242 RepID=A0A7J0BRQ4_9BACT|nr:YibE/F family protein [Desulfovibrio psychrotolerans]GFM36396.1 membrane protein [Desulfovibrio psychrotolerans]